MFRPDAGMHLRAHHHVLPGRQAFMQVVGLEDEAQLAPHGDQSGLVRPREFLPHQPQAALLNRPQAADQRQQRGLARTRRPHQHGEAAAVQAG
jgi:hypothetical protein